MNVTVWYLSALKMRNHTEGYLFHVCCWIPLENHLPHWTKKKCVHKNKKAKMQVDRLMKYTVVIDSA